MHVRVLESSVSDNYFYLVHDEAGRAALIDPVDAPTAIDAIRADGLELEFVINTHFHHDHIAGDDAVLAAFPQANLLAGPDAARISVEHGIDKELRHGEDLRVGSETFRILETPGHTPGHISLLNDTHLFSGDTIFVGGAGNCTFGGDPGVLFRTFHTILSELDDDVRFYPGHDYALRNIEFALALQPEDDVAQQMLDRVRGHEGGPFLTTLGEERAYSPFFRYDDPALADALRERHGDLLVEQRRLAGDDDEAVFRTIRALRNDW